MKSPHTDHADRRRDLIDVLAIALLPRLVRRGAAESAVDRARVPPPVTAARVTRPAQTPRSTPTPGQAWIA